MKDVLEGKATGKFVGLKSKLHSMKTNDGRQSNTAKGVYIATEFNEYKDTLFNQRVLRHKMKIIQSKKQQNIEFNKISLLCFDGKRFVLDDGIHTLAYFHKDIDSHR